ncbi:DUF4246 domain-containing protein [Aspergillus aculeatinus CBS 121060]|uniref:Uncharacterized protein n=1 Tax=Aspergillus aculeatinus CBS 121060 TaxID=1448322 RepID=A0ACD1H2E4_9EURO|nr:hypothetical protein BO66DRAFT_393788 [Aspergillus aculeatinus CBS 121060]RAH67596.1 hypothetical protein BO66DRAFT_393788 [Aspergillus aculeatinus CBS 121060]
MERITNKPRWFKKIFNKHIAARWRREITEQDIPAMIALTTEMIDWIIEELHYKAEFFLCQGMVKVFDEGIMKSDSIVPEDLRLALLAAVRPLEDVPANKKDYHPSSDRKIVNLVHPFLCPLVYGRTRILRNSVTNLANFLEHTGRGEILPVPNESGAHARRPDHSPYRTEDYSRRFQWLPCNVKIYPDGHCRIASYINNLRLDIHCTLYDVIEKIITCAVPLWNETLTLLIDDAYRNFNRIDYSGPDMSPPEPEEHTESEVDLEHEEPMPDDWSNRLRQWRVSHRLPPPKIGEFEPFPPVEIEVDMKTMFQQHGLQVIVKLTNIELTPEKPSYAGGSWHIAGRMNEHICATAVYYYSNHNITPGRICFRQRLNLDDVVEFSEYEGCPCEWVPGAFGTGNLGGPLTQVLGSVECRQGRLLTFPNIVQHRVLPFALADPTRSGHRKILTLFLVDPNLQIISTANVPPQQADWFEETARARHEVLARWLPTELQDMIQEHLGGDNLIGKKEAEDLRVELMEEQSAVSKDQGWLFDHHNMPPVCSH